MTATSTKVRPKAPRSTAWLKWGVTAAILIPFVWGILGLEINPNRIWNAIRPGGQFWTLVGAMFPPDWAKTGRTFDKILESLYVAWIGTMIGAAFSFPLAFLAATNMAPRWVATPVRGLLSGIRAFPELVLAIIFIPALGLGPFPGALAIGLHSIGTLGKLSSEVIEGIDHGPLEAIKAAGGTKAQEIRMGVLPQAMPNILAYWIYRFEINIRASAVLGVIGAGGVGNELVQRLQRREMPAAGTVLLLTVATVLVIDTISSAVRRRIISGEPSQGLIARFFRLFSRRNPIAEVA
jgi:phosphonate transport system permease protein